MSAPLADEAALRRSHRGRAGALSSAVVSDGEIPAAVADDTDDHQGNGHRRQSGRPRQVPPHLPRRRNRVVRLAPVSPAPGNRRDSCPARAKLSWVDNSTRSTVSRSVRRVPDSPSNSVTVVPGAA